MRDSFPHAQQQLLHHQPRLRVERAERLVHQEQLRLADPRAGERDSLLHAARELVRVMLFEACEAHQPHVALSLSGILLGGAPAMRGPNVMLSMMLSHGKSKGC